MEKPYVRELTGLRGWAALWVTFFHLQYGFNFSPDFYFLLFPSRFIQKGYLAVDIFFILSGYVMALTCASWEGRNPFDFFKSFIWRRLARIYPLHLFSLLLMMGLALFSVPTVPWEQWGRSILAHLTLTHSWGEFYTPDWNYPSWSISAEWAAYLSFPLLLLLNRKVSRSLSGIAAAVILPMAALIWLAYSLKEGSMDMTWDWGWYRCLIEFWIGLSLWRLGQMLGPMLTVSIKKSLGTVLTVIAAISLGLFLESPLPDPVIIPLATVLIFSVVLGSRLWTFILGNRVSNYLGEISYSLYMLHVPVGLTLLKLWRYKFGELQSAISGFVALTVTLMVLFLVASLMHHYFEKPLRQWMTQSRSTFLFRR